MARKLYESPAGVQWGSADRTWRDVRACLCTYGVMWDRSSRGATELVLTEADSESPAAFI
eukprot:3247200-Pyramimonas_sp.AAC.1